MSTDKAKKIVKKKNLFPIVLAVFFIVMVLPTFVRYYSGNHTLIGSESYQHMKAAAQIERTNSWNPFDPPEKIKELVYTERTQHLNPYHYLLAYAGKIVSLPAASRIVPFILGLLTILIFNLILKNLVEEKYKRNLILILLVINPAFIYTFTISNPHSAAIFFSLLGIYFFIREKGYNILLAAICFALVSMFSLFNTLIVALVLLGYVIVKKEYQGRLTIIYFLLAVLFFWRKIGFYYNYTYSPKVNILGNLVSDLGGITGFGVFTIILAIYGIYSHWEKKNKFAPFMAIAAILFISLFYVGNIANMYLAFLIAFAAGTGLVHLLNANWDVRTIKNMTLLIVLCGLLFSTVSYMTREVAMQPQQELIDALDWMQGNTFKDGFTLTHYDNGYLVSAIARNPVLADSFLTSEYSQKFIYKTEDTMFYSRKLTDIKKLFAAYNVKHILIDSEMKEGKVWSKENEGLLFLFTNQNTFEKIYDENGVEIWKVKNTTTKNINR